MPAETATPDIETLPDTDSPDTDTAHDIDFERLMRLVPRYNVILHNDDHHSMFYVVDALCKSVSSLSRRKAMLIMTAAHTFGKAIVITCPQETAELYRDRILSFGLGCTIEPVE